MAKLIEKYFKEIIFGGVSSLLGGGAKWLWERLTQKEMDNFTATGIVFFFVLGAILLILGFIGWAYATLSKIAENEKVRIDTEKARIDELIKSVQLIEKRVSPDYDSEHWPLVEQKQNVFYILRKEMDRKEEALSVRINQIKDLLLNETKIRGEEDARIREQIIHLLRNDSNILEDYKRNKPIYYNQISINERFAIIEYVLFKHIKGE